MQVNIAIVFADILQYPIRGLIECAEGSRVGQAEVGGEEEGGGEVVVEARRRGGGARAVGERGRGRGSGGGARGQDEGEGRREAEDRAEAGRAGRAARRAPHLDGVLREVPDQDGEARNARSVHR